MNRIMALAFAGVVAGIVIVAALVDHRREVTFMPGAPTLDAPVTVGWGGGLWSFDSEILRAINEVNARVGCQVLQPSGPDGVITLLTLEREACNGRGRPLAKHHDAGTYHCPDGKVDIQIARLTDTGSAYVLFLHELGHALGLAHDDSGNSVMRTPPPPAVMPLPTFTPKDAKALRGRYCR